MKKRVMSALLALSMLAIAFFEFINPALATGDTIYISSRYHEEVIDIPEDTTSYILNFTVPFTGYYIIQTFGHPIATLSDEFEDNGAILRMTLLQGTSTIAITHGSPVTGYGRGRFINCYLGEGITFTLRISLTGVQSLRLSFTYAEGVFNGVAPISSYNDIFTDGPEIFEFTFTEDDGYYAQVARVLCSDSEEGDYRITLSGGGYEHAYILDPTTTDYFAGVQIEQYGAAVMHLRADVPYYIVVFLGIGDNPLQTVDIIDVELSFERIG